MGFWLNGLPAFDTDEEATAFFKRCRLWNNVVRLQDGAAGAEHTGAKLRAEELDDGFTQDLIDGDRQIDVPPGWETLACGIG